MGSKQSSGGVKLNATNDSESMRKSQTGDYKKSHDIALNHGRK